MRVINLKPLVYIAITLRFIVRKHSCVKIRLFAKYAFFVFICSVGISHANSKNIRTNIPECGANLTVSEEYFFDESLGYVNNDKLRLGTNILYWIDKKSDWKKFELSSALSELGVKVLRFPGGEVADNYSWETNSIERGELFPREAKTLEEKEDRLDFRTFLKKADEVGVDDIYFVVNLEGAFFQSGDRDDNILAYARSAARWVKEVHDSGYKVKYWEIGNESYHHSAFPLTAKEYANALRVFYKEMKRADPDIMIGALGPFAHEGKSSVGFADRIHPELLEQYRTEVLNGNAYCKKKNKKVCSDKINGSLTYEGSAWWSQVVKIAPDAFDFIVLHKYGKYSKNKHRRAKKYGYDIALTKQYVSEKTGRDLPVSMTEWNMPSKTYSSVSEGDHAINIAAQLIGLYRSGVKDVFYWPFRIRGNMFRLLDLKSAKRYSAYNVLKLISKHSTGEDLIFSTTDLPRGVEIFSTHANNMQSLVLVNASDEKKNIAWAPSIMTKSDLMITQLNSNDGNIEREEIMCSGISVSKQLIVSLPAKALVTIQLDRGVTP